MSTQEIVENILKDIKQLLQHGGKDIVVVEAKDNRVRFRLEGFCSGCGCGDSYRDGLREMIQNKIPNIEIDFEYIGVELI